MHTVEECVCCGEIPQTLIKRRVDGVEVECIRLHPAFCKCLPKFVDLNYKLYFTVISIIMKKILQRVQSPSKLAIN